MSRARGSVFRRRTGGGGTTPTVTTYLTDTFPQANGSAPDATKWGLGANSGNGAGSVTVQDNALRFRTGNGGNYSNQDNVGRRNVLSPTLADFEYYAEMRYVGEVYPSFYFRSSRSDIAAAGTSYILTLGTGTAAYYDNYASTSLGTPNPLNFNDGSWWCFKVRVSGSSIQVRIWPEGTIEPTPWNYLTATSSTKLTAGEMGWDIAGGGDPASQDFLLRNVKITSPSDSTVVVTPPVPAGSAFISGLSVDGTDGVEKTTLATQSPFRIWRGGTRNVDAVSTWADNSISTSENIWAFSLQQNNFGVFPGIVDIAIGGLYPGEGQTWAQAAAGAYDSMWRKSLEVTAQYRRGKGNAGTYIRPFHEFNGSWYPWALHNAQEVAYFKQCWVRIWNLKQQIFPEAKMHWSPNRETSGLPIRSTDAWPGDAYVDAVAPDYYFQWPGYTTQAAWDASLNATDGTGGPKGIEAWRQFALSHGKPLCIPEWGTNSEPGVPEGPYPPYVDQPISMKSFLDYLEAYQGSGPGQFIYANYFNAAQANDDYSGKFGLYPYTESPQAAAAYKAWHSAR